MIRKFSNLIRPKYYRKYVDYLFLIFEYSDHVNNFLKYSKSRHPNIIFNCEKATNDKVSSSGKCTKLVQFPGKA